MKSNDSDIDLQMNLNVDHEWSENLDCFSLFNNDIYTTPKKDNNNHEEYDEIDKPWNIIRGLLEVPFLLTSIGILTAIMSFIIIKCVQIGNTSLSSLMIIFPNYQLIIFVIWSISMALISCFIVQQVQEAAGGGLSEMKSILSGLIKPILLSKRLIIAKTLGLIFAILAGLSVGKEGPFVSIAAAIADQLMKLKYFSHIRRQDNKRLEILACACASGVSSSFGCAFGGLFFSIEFTSSSFLVKNLPKVFLTSVVGMVTLTLLAPGNHLAYFDNTQSNDNIVNSKDTITLIEIIIFILVGITCSLVGVFFVYLVEALSAFRNRLLDPMILSKDVLRKRRYVIVFLATAIIAPFTYYEIISDGKLLFTLRDVMFTEKGDSYSLQVLSGFFFYKFVVTAISVSLPLPCGLFSPVFLAGSLLGRIICLLLHANGKLTSYSLSQFAIVGAVSFSTGVTRAISTALIVYELSGQRQIRLPLSIALLSSYFFSNRFTKNVYDVLIDTNRVPFLQELPREIASVIVHEVMTPIDSSQVVSLSSTFKDALKVITSDKCKSFELIPVVKSKASMVIVGATKKNDIANKIKTMKRQCKKNSNNNNNDKNIIANDIANDKDEDIANDNDRDIDIEINIESKSYDSNDDMLNKPIHFVVLVGNISRPFQSLQSQLTTNSNISPFKYSIDSDKDNNNNEIFIDPSPYQIVYTSQLSKVDTVFRMLKLNTAFVTETGRLTGIVTRENLRTFIGSRQKHPTERLKQLMRSIYRYFHTTQQYSPIN